MSQQLNIQAELQSVAKILEQKIVLSSLEYGQATFSNHSDRVLSKPRIKSIVYSCPIVSLASYLRHSPAIVTKNLADLLSLNQDNTNHESGLNLQTKITSPGWIEFYLDFKAIASWLERSQLLIETAADSTVLSTFVVPDRLSKTSENLFPAQYVHARCCSLLRLGAREKLITLKDANLRTWQIQEPQSISWLDQEQNLWLTKFAEYNLLRQLFAVTDSFAGDFNNWLKLALNLSSTTVTFLADCRFLGEVKQEFPQRAIARLGLIALTQYWLQRILIEKLGVAAPTEL
ncbi:hypothetical protein IQ255_16085 [Pleurocapsales cyanobacterium LEGE 10410]|nr:hypothetical protein [Pleurocapsales cyanobacterium LEGE 10410]